MYNISQLGLRLQICTMVDGGEGTVHWDDEQKGPFYTNDSLWVGYDNTRSISEKVIFKSSCF